MKRYSWNAEKNEQLQKTRGISFEEIVFHIQTGGRQHDKYLEPLG